MNNFSKPVKREVMPNTAIRMRVKAPKGYHWMKQKNGSFKLMKHSGKFVKHKGASLTANFAIQKRHTK